MPVRNCCLGCQGPKCGPCGAPSVRYDCCSGPSCWHKVGDSCSEPSGQIGVKHGARGGTAGSYFGGGFGCIGGCTGSLCKGCCKL